MSALSLLFFMYLLYMALVSFVSLFHTSRGKQQFLLRKKKTVTTLFF